MEETFQLIASYTALAIEAAAVFAVAAGSAEALWHLAGGFRPNADPRTRRQIWVRFASWIIIGLEFTLGADIIRTAIAPSWDDIGKLAAIAGIRTALNFFLERDIEEAVRAKALAKK